MSNLPQYEEAKETAAVLAYLGHMMNYPPDEAFVEKLRESHNNGSPENAEMEEFWQKHKDSEDKDIKQDLAVEWVRLFRGSMPGSGQQPPYAGIFISKDGLGTDIMVALKFMYDRHEFAPSKQDRMDYLGIMLDFAAGLLGNYASCLEKEQTEEANGALVTLKELYTKYIVTWSDRFVNQSLSFTKNPFYREYLLTLQDAVNNISDILKHGNG